LITNCVKNQVSVHDVMAQKGVNDVVALNTYCLVFLRNHPLPSLPVGFLEVPPKDFSVEALR